MAKGKFERTNPHVNGGTIGHVIVDVGNDQHPAPDPKFRD